MDKKALVKLAVAAATAAAATAGSQYIASDSVNFSAVLASIATTILALLHPSPTAQ